ncbi:uvrD-like Helicase, ATP-binding domain, P-loop containing nucleoside triphosphate hydrolase [Artemisia annua]|uniref:UvrD-like Helicase, ATP-binding domain, P-loop containing nucleoside triphosphate hydrolase n=1 Tax=Artemisia annua TaxID=35608 RepID=A0A2U1NS98_ARTAN|nr:uvrD-like Helicase, ATP-binding domain, P-loop containing nucleoside triphosphate hydrolase [Artemisia annua]
MEEGSLRKFILSWPLDHILNEDFFKNQVEKELQPLDDLVNRNSVLYKNAKWKVLFSDDFKRSFGKLTCDHLKRLVLSVLLRLSNGWWPQNRSLGLCHDDSSKTSDKSYVEGLYIICTLDIIKDINYVQVMKVWDILHYKETPKLIKRLENIYSAYTEDYISRCTEKLFEGDLKVPRCWAASQEVIRFRHLVNDEGDSDVSVNSGGGRNFVENSKVSESLLMMKFYSLSYEVVCHLLSGKEVDLPMQLTDEQMDILLFSKSSFIIGRSGTGKTTILTTKLFQNEESFYSGCKGIYEAENAEVVDDPENSKPSVLHQLFVTVSPKLCYAVKQQVSHLTSISRNGNSSAEISLDDVNVTSEFSDIPDTFIDIPRDIYPLVITFHKFLMMLDGTLGNSFFERFLEAKESSPVDSVSSRSVRLQTLIRLREVTFDRFCSLYWPHFNSNLTKELDLSRVFTEIISHIKGGSDGKLSFEDYCLLTESRSSTLTEDKRKIVYTLFQAYEKMKREHGDFDLGDFVNHIHHQLKNEHYEGDQMDFVYIDEVQDLSMRQISLFKYICQNVEEGFIFAGDTAQTIARGIDFRFQDIRSLFYKEFLSTRISRKQEKGLVSEIKQLKQNFRTHAGVLDLAQSVIDILYCYFVHSIDKLEPETSLVSGEAPVLLESCNDENAIVTIFGGSRSDGETVGFGAEQVILVRDDRVKSEVVEYVGRQALVLTILECKGLEFQDVLLYNFFGTSILKDQWRVIYGYMIKHNWLDEKLPESFPSFNEARHSILCSELKELYVAITRTRQRLWICESKEERSKPMFDYWKMRGLVQIRKLDDSVAQAMRASSSPQEWRERGKKLFSENNFVMAKLCFERAGDTMWENFTKASDLRASADQIQGTNRESYLGYLREAAGMFESIGKFESAALCYCDMGEYERAGKVYLYKCGKIDAAAECFTLAGCYSDAAEAYAQGDEFSKCVSVCKRGNLFERGLQFIESWKKGVKVKSKEIEQFEQEFLENCALDFHGQKDYKYMVKFVKAFCSMEYKRTFLRSLGCLDELLLLEEESGHFVEAADLARSWGDLPKAADLLEKAGYLKEAAILLHRYVIFRAIWGNGNKEICNKVKSLVKMDQDLYALVSSELKIISDQHNSLPEVKKDLHASQKNGSLMGEILSIRKILDAHFHIHFTKYEWEDELPIDLNEHCDKIFKNQVSVRTLAFYWNLWKKHIVDMFKNDRNYASEFNLTYFGVSKLNVDGDTIYVLIDKDVDWSELLSVGFKVLETLEGLYKSKLNGSAFHQSSSLLHIFEVSKFLSDYRCLVATNINRRKLQRFLGVSSNYFDLVFPLDWRNVVSHDMISLRETDLSVNLLEEIIHQMVDIMVLGRVLMICLGSRVSVAVYENLINKLKLISEWKPFVEKFRDGGMRNVYAAPALQNALESSFRADWKYAAYLSPHSFVYLLDRLILMQSLTEPFPSQFFYTTRSTFVGSFTHIHSASTLSIGTSSSDVSYVVKAIQQILKSRRQTISWFQRSKFDGSYYPLLALKMVMILSLVCLKVTDCSPVLLELLSGNHNIAYCLPKKFVHDLLIKRKNQKLNLDPEVVAEAFTSVDDPLLIAHCAIFVDLRKSKEEIMSILFPRKNKHDAQTSLNNVDAGTIPEVSSSSTLPDTKVNMNRVELQINWKFLEKVSNTINGTKGVAVNKLSTASMIKDELDTNKGILATVLANPKSCSGKDATAVYNAFECLKLLSFAFDTRRTEVKHSDLLKKMEDAMEGLHRYRPNIDDILKNSVVSQELKVKQMVVSGSNRITETGDKDSLMEMVLENLSISDNTQDAEKEKGKGTNKEKVSNTINGTKGVAVNKLSTASMIKDELDTNKGILATVLANPKSCSGKDATAVYNAFECLKLLSFAFDTRRTEVKHSDLLKKMEDAMEGLQRYRPNIDDILKISVVSQELKVKQMVVSGSNRITETGDKDSLMEMVLENLSISDNTQDAKKEKGKGTNKGKKSKKNKGQKK